jgi:uncharacterized membrane protein
MSGEMATTGLRAWLRKHYEILLLGGILLVALALRLYQLEADSFWIDELTQIKHSRVPFVQVFGAALIDDGSTPLDYIVTHFAYYYMGRSEAMLRLPPVLWGVLSVATIYFLGKRMFDKTTGFLAAALLTILPSHVYYSQEVRPYSLPALVILLATYAFCHALGRNTRSAWALYGATLAVGMYCHYYVVIVCIFHGVYLVLMALAKRLPWDRLMPFIVAAGAGGLLFLPWVVADTFGSTTARFSWPTISTLFVAPFALSGASYRFALTNPLTWCAAFMWASAIVGVVLYIRGRSAARDNMGLLSLVAVGGMVVTLLLDFLADHFFPTRHFLPYAPLLVLLAAGAAIALVRMGAQRLTRVEAQSIVTATSAVLLLVLAGATLAGSLSAAYKHQKQDWRGVSRYLLLHAEAEDAVLLRVTFDVEFYAPELSGQIVRLRGMKTVREAAEAHPRVWIVDWSSALGRYVPDVGEWAESEKPLRIRGFSGMELYVHSETLTSQELQDSLKR